MDTRINYRSLASTKLYQAKAFFALSSCMSSSNSTDYIFYVEAASEQERNQFVDSFGALISKTDLTVTKIIHTNSQVHLFIKMDWSSRTFKDALQQGNVFLSARKNVLAAKPNSPKALELNFSVVDTVRSDHTAHTINNFIRTFLDNNVNLKRVEIDFETRTFKIELSSLQDLHTLKQLCSLAPSKGLDKGD